MSIDWFPYVPELQDINSPLTLTQLFKTIVFMKMDGIHLSVKFSTVSKKLGTVAILAQ